MVYVVNKHGKPLMPTKRYKHVKDLLKNKLAVPINNKPFTIKLKYEVEYIIQALTCGVDVGRENIGIGISNEKGECIFVANVETNNKMIAKRMQERASYRKKRRYHKRQKKQRKAIKTKTTIQNGNDDILRSTKKCKSKEISYPGMEKSITHKVIQGKEAKFNNRNIPKGWITPSARNLVQIHVNLIKDIQSFIPISKIIIENNVFDFQKLDNTDIENWEYQEGPLYGFKNYKDYIYHQQNGKCLLCGKNDIDHYHHIIYRSRNGSNTPEDIAGLCEPCHVLVHNNASYEEELRTIKPGTTKKYEISLLNSCMGIIIEELNKLLPVTSYRGFDTAQLRKELGLDKDHCVDGYVISLLDRKDTIDKNDITTEFNPYYIKHFKKKSNNNINTLGSREYYYKNKLVAINRHKAMTQQENSLEEYLSKYAETHSKKETAKHFHELTVSPAKRTYTYHQNNVVLNFKCGDKVLYYKKRKSDDKEKRKIFVVEKVVANQNRLFYDKTKAANMKFCHVLESKSLVYI